MNAVDLSAATLLEDLQSYRLGNPAEGATVDRFESFMRSCPRPFARTALDGHVTASVWLVNAAGSEVLLTHHRKLGIWVQLGGHVGTDPDIREAARREAEEESGIADLSPVSEAIFDIDIHQIPARPARAGKAALAAHLHYDVRFVWRAAEFAVPVISPESHALAWVNIRDLGAVTNEQSMLRMAGKWLAGWP